MCQFFVKWFGFLHILAILSQLLGVEKVLKAPAILQSLNLWSLIPHDILTAFPSFSPGQSHSL